MDVSPVTETTGKMASEEKKRRNLWKDEDMLSAMEAVFKSEMSVSRAAAAFSVPRKTLDDRIKGRVEHGTKPGRSTVLTEQEEKALCSYLIYMAERGFPLTRRMVMAFAWAIALRSGKGDRFNSEIGPGEHWWINFRKRHPEISLRKVDKLERSRAECLDPEVVKEYFEMLEKTLSENGLMNNPRRLYNCDETFLPLDGTREKAVTSKRAKSTYAQAIGTREHITMLCGASAAGTALPPMIIFPKAFPGGKYTFKGPDDAVYAKSDSGWVDSELFLSWMNKVFLRYAVPQRPVLLFVDGHTSHMTLDVIDVARSNGVILFCLPPHTTHALQPLDVAVFKSLKDNFFKATRAVSFCKTNFIVTKREFAAMVKGPFEKAFSMVNIKAGFAKTGIFPFNPNAIDMSKMKPSEVYNSPASQSSLDSSREGESIALALNTSSSSSGVPEPGPNTSSEAPSCSYVPNTPTPLTVTPPVDSSTPMPPGSGLSIVNPLVRAGLVPTYLADIFSVPDEQSQSTRKRRRITKTRVLTEDEYMEMLKEKEAKENEAKELKKKRREERERKKEEREAQKKKKEEERKQKGQSQEGKKGKGRAKRIKESASAQVGEEEASSNSESEEPVRRSSRARQPPSRFLGDCSSDSDSDGATLCGLCNCRDPETTQASIVYWVDCSNCGAWFHTSCALGDNCTSRQYVCNSCL